MNGAEVNLEKFIDVRKWVLGFRSGVAEKSVFLGYDTALLSHRFPTFRDNVAPSSFKTPGRHFDPWRWDHYTVLLSYRFPTFRDNVAPSSFKTPGRHFDPWRWDHCVVPKRRQSITRRSGVTLQRIQTSVQMLNTRPRRLRNQKIHHHSWAYRDVPDRTAKYCFWRTVF